MGLDGTDGPGSWGTQDTRGLFLDGGTREGLWSLFSAWAPTLLGLVPPLKAWGESGPWQGDS